MPTEVHAATTRAYAEAIQRAGRATRGEEVLPAGPRPGIDPADSARLVPALVPPPAR